MPWLTKSDESGAAAAGVKASHCLIAPDSKRISGSLDGAEVVHPQARLSSCRGLRKLHLGTAPASCRSQNPSLRVFSRIPASIYGVRCRHRRGPAGVSAPSPNLSAQRCHPAGRHRLTARRRCRSSRSASARAAAWATIFSPFVRFVGGDPPAEEGWFNRGGQRLLAVLGQGRD